MPQPSSSNPATYLALSCVGFLASAPAIAAGTEAEDADQQAGQIVVTGQRNAKAELVGTPKITATLLDTPRSITVIDKEVIRQTGSATLVDALRTVPGITFGAAEGGNPIGDRPFIRGFDSQGSTYLDGVRDIGAQSREVFAVEQIQVVRGSDSTLGGRGSAGGSLNIISKLPQAHRFVDGALSYGSADYKRATIDANQPLSATVAVRVAAMWHDQDVAGRDAIFQKRWGVAPSITIGLGGPTRLTASYYHLHTNELPDSGLPYLYTIGNTPNPGESLSGAAIGTFQTIGGATGTVHRDTFYGLEDRDFRKTDTDQFTIRFEHELGAHVTFRNTARYSHTSQGYIYTQPDDSQGNVYGTNAAVAATAGGLVWRRANTRYGTTDALTNQSDLYGTFTTGAIKHSFAGGIEISQEDAVRGTYVLANGAAIATGSTITPRCTPAMIARYNCTSAFAPNPGDPWLSYASDTSTALSPIVKSAPITQTLNNASTRSAYAFDSITISEALILNLGARFDRFASKVSPGLVLGTAPRFSLRRKDELFNYQAGVIFKPTPNTSLYVSTSTAATPPNALIGEGAEGNGLGTTTTAQALAILDALKVEKTKSYEAGGKADLFGGSLSLSAAVFRTDTKNARVTIDANTVAFIGERRVDGAELSFNGSITPGWTVLGGYTYLDAKIVDAGFSALTAPALAATAATPARAAQVVYVPSVNQGRRFPQTAKHSATLWSNLEIGHGLSVGGGAFYTGRVYGGYSDNRAAVQSAATGAVTVTPATKVLSRYVPGYVRFDARAAMRIAPQIELAVNVQNLTNKTYFSQAYSNHYATIAPGRSAFATLSVHY